MTSSPSRERNSLAWGLAAAWILIIYAAIPIARLIQAFVSAHWGRRTFLTVTVTAVLLATFGSAGYAWRRWGRGERSRLLWVGAVAIGFLAGAYGLRANPEEALHLIEYGVLGLLLYRALRFSVPDRLVYLCAAVLTAIAGVLDEVIQWITPGRFWDWRDVCINASSGALLQVAIARAFPFAVPLPRPSPRSRRLLRRLITTLLVLILACLAADILSRSSPTRSLRLVFFTDVHARTEWGTPEALRRAADAINVAEPELVIAGGDLITEGFTSGLERLRPRWEAYRSMHEAIHARVLTVPGNHDLVGVRPTDGSAPEPDPRAFFRAAFRRRRTYGSADMNGYHFVLLDSAHILPDRSGCEGRMDAEQLNWLRRDLANVKPATPIVAITHFPLATDTSPSRDVIVNAEEILAAFQGRRLVLVLQGHLHEPECFQRGSTTFITGGAICGQWWRGPWQGAEEGFGIVTLTDDRVAWEYVDYGWTARRPEGE